MIIESATSKMQRRFFNVTYFEYKGSSTAFYVMIDNF